MAKKKRFDEILQEYGQKYDIETLDSPNDRANLTMLINNQVIIERLQAELLEVTEESAVENIDEVKQIGNAMRDLVERSLQIERALALDRKTRKSENSDSLATYLTDLKVTAQNFLEKRLIKLYCPDCKVLVARFSPVMDHTAFHFECQCSQCNKRITATRKSAAEGVLFDIKDYKWRKQYLYEVVQPVSNDDKLITESDEEVILSDGSSEED
jgi:predicted nucleic-acid-binding protein